MSDVKILDNYGFIGVGEWLVDDKLKNGARFVLRQLSEQRVVYAFVAGEHVRYVGVCDNAATTLKKGK